MNPYGVAATVGDHQVMVGADRYMTCEGVDFAALRDVEQDLAGRGRTALYAAIDGRIAGVIAVADPVKSASRAAICALRKRGVDVVMIPGDKAETAEAIARETGIDQLIAGVLPDDKVRALAHADVGIAIGTDVAIESADVVLMSGDLRGVVNAVEVSGRTMTNIRQNLI